MPAAAQVVKAVGAWIRPRFLVLLTFAFVFGLAVPHREHFGGEDVNARTLAAMKDDQEFAKDGSPPEYHDDWSYLAAARHPFGSGYLERREPYLSRFAQPVLVKGITRLGLGIDLSFFVVSSAGLLIAALAVRRIALDLGAGVIPAALGGSLFLLAPTVANGFIHASHVDPGAWALMLWSVSAALRRRTALAFGLLLIACCWRETALFILPGIAWIGWRDGERRQVLVGTAAVLVALLLPRAVLTNSFNPGLIGLWRLAVLGVMQKVRGPATGASIFLHALSLAAVLLPFTFRKFIAEHHREAAPLVVVAATFILLGVLSNDGARLMPPAAVLVIPAGVCALDWQTRRDRIVMGILLIGGVASCAGWILGGLVVAAQLGAAVLVVATMLWFRRSLSAQVAA